MKNMTRTSLSGLALRTQTRFLIRVPPSGIRKPQCCRLEASKSASAVLELIYLSTNKAMISRNCWQGLPNRIRSAIRENEFRLGSLWYPKFGYHNVIKQIKKRTEKSSAKIKSAFTSTNKNSSALKIGIFLFPFFALTRQAFQNLAKFSFPRN